MSTICERDDLKMPIDTPSRIEKERKTREKESP